MKNKIAVIDWFGPYSLEEARRVSQEDFDDGLYMLIGRIGLEKRIRLKYAGLAKRLANRLSKDHHIIAKLKIDMQVWLGEVASPRISGKKTKPTDTLLSLSEWTLAYFIPLPLNDRKKKNPPPEDIIVYNRWWKATTDYSSPSCRPRASWPDIIDFHEVNDEKWRCRIVWFGKRIIDKEL